MKKLLDCDWLRKECKNVTRVQKRVTPVQLDIEILDYDWLINNTVFEKTNQIFCFQIKRAPWMAQFFPDCVIRVHFFCLTISNFFMYVINK